MKRANNIAVAVGFVAVLAFAVARFSGMRTSSSDLHQLSPRIVELLAYVAVVVAIFLAMVWVAGLLWRNGNLRTTGRVPTQGLKRHRPKIALAALSVVLGMAAEAMTGMQGPGMLVMQAILAWLHVQSLRIIPLYFLMGILLDSALCFAILNGTYLLLGRVQGKASNDDSEVEK